MYSEDEEDGNNNSIISMHKVLYFPFLRFYHFLKKSRYHIIKGRHPPNRLLEMSRPDQKRAFSSFSSSGHFSYLFCFSTGYSLYTFYSVRILEELRKDK